MQQICFNFGKTSVNKGNLVRRKKSLGKQAQPILSKHRIDIAGYRKISTNTPARSKIAQTPDRLSP
jgi:hypothetical protein